MAHKVNEAVNESESEGDSLSSLKVIHRKSTKARRDASKRTYSTSEVDKEEKKSTKIVTEFLTRSPVINSPVNSTRHAPLLSHEVESNNIDTLTQQTAEMDLNTVCKKKMSGKMAHPTTFYSPPARHRPNDFSPASRPRSRSEPSIHRSTKHLTDEEECIAKLVGSRLNEIASRINPKMPAYQEYEHVLFESLATTISQTGHQVVPVQIFRHALEMVRGQSSGWTYRSIVDMLFYGRKLLSQFLINFEGDDTRLIEQFVEFFNVQCLPWIRSHGGWGEVLHHSEDEGSVDMSILDTSNEGDQSKQSSGYGSMEQPPVEEFDERDNASVTPTVFSSDSDEDNSTLEPASIPPLPVSHSTPARQLSDIPEIESPPSSLHPPPTMEETDTPGGAENPPTSQPGSDPSTSNNILFYTSKIAVAGAMIYNKLNY